MSLETEIQAKCVWGEGPRDLLIVAETAFVFGPLNNPGHIKEGSGWAKVHIDLSIDQAKALIVQLQTGIAEAEHLNDVCSAHDEAQ